MQIGKVIRSIRESKGVSQSFLAKKSGLSISYMNCIEMQNEHADNVGLSTLQKIADALEVELADIILRASNELATATTQLIPILGIVNQAEQHTELNWQDQLRPLGQKMGVLPVSSQLNDPEAYALIVGDDSMNPIGKGWLLIVSPQAPCHNNDLVIVGTPQQMWFRRWQKSSDIQLFHGTNAQQDVLTLTRESILAMHKVWGLQTK